MRCSCGRLAEEPPWRACRKGRRPHFVNSPASIFIIHNACPAHLQQLACPAAAGAPPSGRPPAISASLRRSRASEKSYKIKRNTSSRADGAASALSHSGGAAAVCPLRAPRPRFAVCTHPCYRNREWPEGCSESYMAERNKRNPPLFGQCNMRQRSGPNAGRRGRCPFNRGCSAVSQSAGVWGPV